MHNMLHHISGPRCHRVIFALAIKGNASIIALSYKAELVLKVGYKMGSKSRGKDQRTVAPSLCYK